MTISKTQPMRPAEIELVDAVNGLDVSVTQAAQKADQATADVEYLELMVNDLNLRVTDAQGDVAQCVTATGTLNTEMQAVQSDISSLDEAATTAASNISELQTDVSAAEGNIATLQNAINALASIDTTNYIDNISVAPDSGITINSATLKRWGKVCLLMVNYTIASANAISSGNWKNIFDITGTYAPVLGFAVAAAVNDKSAVAMINNTNALWIKALNAAHSGTHYVGAIYLTN